MRRPSEGAIRKISATLQGHPVSEETRAKISAALRGRKSNSPGWSRGLSKATDARVARMAASRYGKPSPKRGVPLSDEQKKKQSSAMTGRKQTEEQKQKRRENPVRYWKGKTIPIDARKKMSVRKVESWKNPDYVKKVMNGRHLSPNKSEVKLLRLLDSLYPGQWKYTGDFSLTINGKCPDFVNCNGQKKIIEFNGAYWHRNDIPGERERIFAKFGYDTLIIWDYEMKNMADVERKIRYFHERIAA